MTIKNAALRHQAEYNHGLATLDEIQKNNLIPMWTYHAPAQDPLTRNAGRPRFINATDPDMMIILRYQQDAARWYISGIYYNQMAGKDLYKNEPENQERPSITVSIARTAAAIAGEITRRLIPLYRPLYEDLKTELLQRIADDQKETTDAAKLARIIGCKHFIAHWQHRDEQRPTIADYTKKPTIKAEVRTDDGKTSINLEMWKLTMEQAEKIMRQVNRWYKENQT